MSSRGKAATQLQSQETRQGGASEAMTRRVLDSKQKTPILTWAADGMRARPRGMVAAWSHSMRAQPPGSSPVGIPNWPSLWAGDRGSQGPMETSQQNKLRGRTWVDMEPWEGMENVFRMKTAAPLSPTPLCSDGYGCQCIIHKLGPRSSGDLSPQSHSI